MAVASHLERRGAVYYWRRRLPESLARRLNQRCVVVSLRTRELKSARYLAAQLDAAAEKMLVSPPAQWVTKEQLKDFFRRSFAIHEEIIRRAAALPGGGIGSGEQERSLAAINGWTFRLIAEQGSPACVTEQDRIRMAAAGLSDSDIATVTGAVNWHGSPARVAHMLRSVGQILFEVGAATTADNVARAERLYAQAQSEAAFNILPAETYEFDIASLVKEARSAPPSIAWSTTRPSDAFPPAKAVGGPVIPREIAQQYIGEYFETPTETAATDVAIRPAPTIASVAESLIKDKAKRSEWRDKTQRQFLSICDLFQRFLHEETGISALPALTPVHLHHFNQFLLHTIPKSYGKSPSDLKASIAELRRKSEAAPASRRGLDPGTLGRHYTFLEQLLEQARTVGIDIDPKVSFKKYKPKASGRARDEREIPKRSSIAELFAQPVYHGCRDWQQPFETGREVYHRAAYFGPLFAYYHGMRREEFCGLAADDIKTVTEAGEPIAHVKVWHNDIRLLKNQQSRRFLPLHPELLRLGILDYAARIQSLHYGLLFPELRSPNTKSPLGDRYYDEWSKAQLKGITAHPLRHAFNDELKQKRVSEEMRADMMGHGGKTETTERYANAFDLKLQAEDMSHIPVLTSAIPARPIRIIPWVEARQDAPWSRPSRKAKG
ncbi:MAG: tyrosine-type recombinase/integrase [Bosea sp. (in: a-proteobacteria)]|uniref:DUF6538 domain-containing protein n=1 Tax=Bosea sp. (in: a-proteobacteria) TaxID=1871050 RepID=UPI002733D3D0|nr:DUF6538 domain-containing protein [Bosea sp. (in: a-proteobacteria)]MDP3600253.1 tyrosine-type recombinase/integrase [Bosea sp. (in: a-proteobacteria)]